MLFLDAATATHFTLAASADEGIDSEINLFNHSSLITNMPPGFRPQNLNDVFLAAANQARQKPEQLTHNQKVRHGCMSMLYSRDPAAEPRPPPPLVFVVPLTVEPFVPAFVGSTIV